MRNKRNMKRNVKNKVEQWMSVADTAQEHGVTDRCIRKWLQSGKLTGRKNGRKWEVLSTSTKKGIKPIPERKANVPELSTERPPLRNTKKNAQKDNIINNNRQLPPPAKTVPKHEKNGPYYAQSLSVWKAAKELLAPVLSGDNKDDLLHTRLGDSIIHFFEALFQGYHAYHYRDKIHSYHEARDALCAAAAMAALAGDEELSEAIQGEPLAALASLIRSMEKKGKKHGA